MIKVHIFEPLLNTHLFNLIHLIFHQLYHIKEKDLHNKLHFPSRNVFLQKYRHLPSAPGKQLKRMVRYEEQEMVALASFVFFISPTLISQLVFVDSFALSLVCRQATCIQKRLDFILSCSQIVPHGLHYALCYAYSWWSYSEGSKEILDNLLAVHRIRQRREQAQGNIHTT